MGRRGWLKTELPGPGAVVDPIDPESFFRVKDTWTIGCPIQRASISSCRGVDGE